MINIKKLFSLSLICLISICLFAQLGLSTQQNSSRVNNGIYLTTQHMNWGAYSGGIGNGFGGNISGGSTTRSIVSFGNGNFNTRTIPAPRIVSTSPYILQQNYAVYNGDEPGVIFGEENKFLDNPIIGASTHAIETLPVRCDKCHEHLGDITINSYNTLRGTRYEVDVESNNSFLSLIIRWLTGSGLTEAQKDAKIEKIRQELIKNHKCKDNPVAPIGDSIFILLVLCIVYCLIKNINYGRTYNLAGYSRIKSN